LALDRKIRPMRFMMLMAERCPLLVFAAAARRSPQPYVGLRGAGEECGE
jgi:hypothetical protein